MLMGRTTNRWAREVTGDCSGASFIRVWPVWDRKAGCCARRTDEREGSEGRNGRVVCSVFLKKILFRFFRSRDRSEILP